MANEVYVYDIETFPNYFSAVFINYKDYHTVRKPLGKPGKLKVSEQQKIDVIDSVPNIIFEISSVIGHEVNDILRLVEFANQNNYFAGFNSKAYDDNIIKFIIVNLYKFKSIDDTCKKINEFSQMLIKTDPAILNKIPAYDLVRKFHPHFMSIDLQRIPGLDKIFKSLKQTLINVNWHKIQDYHMPPVTDKDRHYYSQYCPIYQLDPWDRFVLKEFVSDILSYNDNDTRGSCELFYVLFDQIKLRFDIGAQFNIYCLCDSDSKIADRFIFKYYCDAAGVKYHEIKDLRTIRNIISLRKIISPLVRFQTAEFNELLDKVNGTVVSSTTELNIAFEYDGTKYNIKSGGLHSEDEPGVFSAKPTLLYRDADVASYYPRLTINNQVAPAHLNKEIFIDVCTVMVNERIEAKNSGDMVKANSLKITINVGMFGKFGFAYSPLFDILCTLTVTINGQLQILMLIERLALAGIRTVSANTDGIVVELPIHLEETYYSICNQWQEEVSLELEYTDYIKYVRRDVNNYITIKKVYYNERKHKDVTDFDRTDEHGKYKLDIKRKGELNQYLQLEDLKKGVNMPIIAKAVEEYFVNNIPVRNTIVNERNIYSFCATQNVARKYKLQLHSINNGVLDIKTLQRNCRFYLSNHGGLLYKVDGNSKTGIQSGKYVTIFNDYFHHDNLEDYDINYRYYITEAQTRIDIILSGITKKTKTAAKNRANIYHIGKLFDDNI